MHSGGKEREKEKDSQSGRRAEKEKDSQSG
jgi:hypothetical protein